MSERVDVPLDALLPPAKDRQAPIDADGPCDLSSGKLAVVGRGEVIMGNPVQFDRAG